MKLELSFDDGGILDFKIVELLKKYDLNRYATFFIPTNALIEKDGIKKLGSVSVIGGHTTSHPQDLKLLNAEDLEDEILSNRDYLKEITGQDVIRFCYPRGRYNDEVKEAVKKAGYISARTTKVFATELSDDPFEKHTTIHMYPRDEYEGEPIVNMAKIYFQVAKKKNGYFHLWGHSEEINRLNLWSEFEEILEYIKDNYEEYNT